MDALIGTTLGGKYRLDRRLGQGGMGMVFAATQVSLNRSCAVKVLHESLTQDHQLVARFKREAEVAASIGHPNIIQVTDFGYEEGRVFLVMDLLQGMPLAHAIQTGAPLGAERVRFIAAQVLSALGAAHEREIVHRDLKPDNIYLTSLSGVADVVKLLDFGIARITADPSQKMTTTGQVLGTPAYMSPEQARGKEVDHRTDIYSLGVVMYEALSGRMPVSGSNYHELMFNIVGEDPTPLIELRPDLPRALIDIIGKAMAKSVDERYQTTAEMRRELEALGPIEATSPPAIHVPSDPPATIDTDPFAKTITPEAVLPVDSTRPPRDASEPAVAVDSQPRATEPEQPPARSATPIWLGAMIVAILGVAAGVWAATRPDPVVADTAPTEDAESEQERAQEIAKQMFIEMRRLEARADASQSESVAESESESESESQADSESVEMTSMTAMSSMSSSMRRPAHAVRFRSLEPPPRGHPARESCCPNGYHDFSNLPIVWQGCGSDNGIKEVYPVLRNTRLFVSVSSNPHVVPMAELRTIVGGYGDEVTECFRNRTVSRGQAVYLDVDESGRVTNADVHIFCPVPPEVRQCLEGVFEGETWPSENGTAGRIRVSIGVRGA